MEINLDTVGSKIIIFLGKIKRNNQEYGSSDNDLIDETNIVILHEFLIP